MAPSDPSDTVLAVCLRVRQSGALRVFVALGRIILDLWAAPPQCGYWGSMGSFCSAPQDFGLLGFFCARFPPREATEGGQLNLILDLVHTIKCVRSRKRDDCVTPSRREVALASEDDTRGLADPPFQLWYE